LPPGDIDQAAESDREPGFWRCLESRISASVRLCDIVQESRMIQDVGAIWSHRYFWLSLIKLDLRNRYRRSVLGIGWSFLMPIAMTAVFCVVFSELLYRNPVMGWKGVAPMILAGMCVWEFLRNSMTGGAMALISNEAYIRQVDLPYSIYPLRAVLGNATHFLIGLFVVICLLVGLRGDLSIFETAWSAIPGVILVTIFSWGVATILSYITVFFRDIKHLIEVVLQVAFFLTPIIYTRDVLDAKGLGVIADLNPCNTFLELIRLPLVEGIVPSVGLMAYGTATAVVAVLLAAGTDHWLRKRVIFHL
jgi:lipopolysaccharide transport system permease protein